MNLQEKVINYSRKAQHPQFGKINNPKLDKGDFVFVNLKLDEIETLRRENERLRKELEESKSQLKQTQSIEGQIITKPKQPEQEAPKYAALHPSDRMPYKVAIFPWLFEKDAPSRGKPFVATPGFCPRLGPCPETGPLPRDWAPARRWNVAASSR